jgi:ATP-dependent helicase/nuclease subunit A
VSSALSHLVHPVTGLCYAAPPDLETRQRLRTDLDTTFFVEAGAGTGKTREMVARIVALVAHGRVSMRELVAITFTAPAAAELRDRVRQALFEAAADSSGMWPDADQRERCARAAQHIDEAAIQTIHAFAANLLREYSLQAGLPPSFDVWDEVQRDQAFEERFRGWLYDQVRANLRVSATLSRVFALGMTVMQLRELASCLEEQYDLLRADAAWLVAPPAPILQTANTHGVALAELGALVHLARDPSGDPLAREVRRVQPLAVRMRDAGTDEDALEALLEYERRPPRSVGAQAAWTAPATGKPHPVKIVKDTFKQATDDINEVLREHRSAALADLLTELSTFVLNGAAARKTRGVANFHDLLVWARGLVLHDAHVRISAANRFRHILVDEFQDTDPLQAELICLLAADTGQANITDWRELRLEPGKLFIIGDPKQSIYRFRRADIAVYEALYARADSESERMVLSQTRRTLAPIVDWVNTYFGCEMHHSPGVQAAYEPLAPRPQLDGVHLEDADVGVRVMGGVVERSAGERWEAEADAIAPVSRHVVREEWLVSARQGERWSVRPARYADICLLLPGRTNLRRLERAFERHDVPYRMESGSLVLQTQEVRDVLSCLRAIDDPSDQVALVAALRSQAYGCSDVDLLAWVEAGGALNYERRSPAIDRPVRSAFENLSAFHAQRMARSARRPSRRSFTIDRWLSRRSASLVPASRGAGCAMWSRKQDAGLKRGTRPCAACWIGWSDSRRTCFTTPRVPYRKLMRTRCVCSPFTAQQGLESPVVIISGLGAGKRPAESVQVVPDYLGGRLSVRCGAFQTPDWDADREKELAEAEALRLWYVAATRAREHLVMSLFRNANTVCPAARIAEVLETSDIRGMRRLQLGLAEDVG